MNESVYAVGSHFSVRYSMKKKSDVPNDSEFVCHPFVCHPVEGMPDPVIGVWTDKDKAEKFVQEENEIFYNGTGIKNRYYIIELFVRND